MPQFERGVYEPGEDVRVFDGSEDEEDVEGSRLPLLIVLALLVLAMFAGVVWLAYTQGVARGRTETPVVTAAAGPARVAPQSSGGAQQPYQGFKIYEQPAPPGDDTPPNQAAAPANQGAAAAPAPALKPTLPAPMPAKPAPPPMTATAKPSAAPVTPPVLKQVPKPVAQPLAKAPPKSQPVPAPATAPPLALAAAPVAAPQPQTGAYVLQIGAYKSQADAETAWKSYKAKHAALLSGYDSNVQKADLGDKGTWYRLRIAGFSSKDAASGVCDRLKADGGGCFPSK